MNRPAGRRPKAEARSRPTTPSSERPAEVIAKAAELFDTRGFHNTSMEDIAEGVGLRKPTLYHYFKSKDEILHRIHDEFIELLIRRQEQRVAQEMQTKILLLEAMGDVLELMQTHRGHVRVFFESHRELPPAEHDEIAAKREHYEQLIRDVFDRGVAEGVFRELPTALVTKGMFGMCNWAYQWYRDDGTMRPRDIAYLFWDMLLNGVAVDGKGRV
jgi:AcrR family transcriptional regulator